MTTQRSPIILGQLDLSFYAVQAELVRRVLERRGHPVEMRRGSHDAIYPLLGAGKIDVFVATWLPHSHSVFWDRYKSEITPLGMAFEGGESFWAVPDYIPAALVASVDDLKTPEVSARMRKRVQGIGAGTGVTQRSVRVVEAYGLADHGYGVVAGSDAQWIASIADGIAAGDWFVCPLWRPQFLNKKYRLRKLDEPRLCMGGLDTGRITAHNSFIARAPRDTIEAISRISIGIDAITDMDYFVNVDGCTVEQAVSRWLADPGPQGWLDGLAPG